VPLEDVVESDIDVEITSEVLVVRASRTWPEPAVLVGILPVPHGFDPDRAVIRFTDGTLEVRIRRVQHWVTR
jgi:HSP20 family molecular chaperone IbpA